MNSCDVCNAPQFTVFDPSLAIITAAALVSTIVPRAAMLGIISGVVAKFGVNVLILILSADKLKMLADYEK